MLLHVLKLFPGFLLLSLRYIECRGSDQGWQYQHAYFVKELSEKNIQQSMSRKGNSIDNGLMESFFGIMKSEMFYGQEDQYETIEDLIKAIDEYMDYYNNKRIKTKLKGLTPVQYRNQPLVKA